MFAVAANTFVWDCYHFIQVDVLKYIRMGVTCFFRIPSNILWIGIQVD